MPIVSFLSPASFDISPSSRYGRPNISTLPAIFILQLSTRPRTIPMALPSMERWDMHIHVLDGTHFFDRLREFRCLEREFEEPYTYLV